MMVPMTSTQAIRTGRKVTATRGDQSFTITSSKPLVITWLRDGELKASAAVSRRAAENGAKVIATNSGDTDIEIVEVTEA